MCEDTVKGTARTKNDNSYNKTCFMSFLSDDQLYTKAVRESYSTCCMLCLKGYF